MSINTSDILEQGDDEKNNTLLIVIFLKIYASRSTQFISVMANS